MHTLPGWKLRAMERGALRRTVAPELLPVSLDEAKERLDILDDNSQDSEIRSLIQQAVDIVERDTCLALMTQTWTLNLDCFPCDIIELRRTPVASVTHVKYYIDETLTTLSSAVYETDFISEPARVRPVDGEVWPDTDDKLNAVVITFVAGYTSAANVPPRAKTAVLLALRHLYHGCSEMGMGYEAVISQLKTFGYV